MTARQKVGELLTKLSQDKIDLKSISKEDRACLKEWYALLSTTGRVKPDQIYFAKEPHDRSG